MAGLDGVFAFNWSASDWDQVGEFKNHNPATDPLTYTLFPAHVGTGANLGKVRFRFFAASGLNGGELSVDQIYASYQVVSRSAGYDDGAIWVDTNASNTNTEGFVDGVADNPVSTWAAALTLSASLGIKRFRIASRSLVVLSANSDDFALIGDAWDLDLNGQSINDAYIEGSSDVVGAGTGSPIFMRCIMGGSAPVTIGPGLVSFCALAGNVSFNQANATYTFDQCFSRIPTASPTVLNTGASIGDVNLNIRHHSGEIELDNLGQLGTDIVSIDGEGSLFIGSNCVGGSIDVSGNWAVTDASGGTVDVTFDDDTKTLININTHGPGKRR